MDGGNLMFYRTILEKANEVHGPGFSLSNKQDPTSGTGWEWFDSDEEAEVYFRAQAPTEPLSTRQIFANAVVAAQAAILDLKENAHKAQVAAGVAEHIATDNGVLLFVEDDEIFAAIGKYEQAGGHPIAAAPLLAKIKAKDLDWLKLPGVLAVFEAALAPPT